MTRGTRKDMNPVDEVKDIIQVTGTVVNCEKLNVRGKKNKTSAVLGIISKGTKVIIDENASNSKWCCVSAVDKSVPGIDTKVQGFCMREFINVDESSYK